MRYVFLLMVAFFLLCILNAQVKNANSNHQKKNPENSSTRRQIKKSIYR